MKVIISIVGAFIVTLATVVAQGDLTSEQKTKIAEYYTECMSSSGVSMDTVLKTRTGVFANDPKLKKFIGCMFRKIGIQSDDGKIHPEVIQAKVPNNIKPEDLKKVMAACKDKKGPNKDDTAFLIYKCYWESSPTHISFGM